MSLICSCVAADPLNWDIVELELELSVPIKRRLQYNSLFSQKCQPTHSILCHQWLYATFHFNTLHIQVRNTLSRYSRDRGVRLCPIPPQMVFRHRHNLTPLESVCSTDRQIPASGREQLIRRPHSITTELLSGNAHIHYIKKCFKLIRNWN